MSSQTISPFLKFVLIVFIYDGSAEAVVRSPVVVSRVETCFGSFSGVEILGAIVYSCVVVVVEMCGDVRFVRQLYYRN